MLDLEVECHTKLIPIYIYISSYSPATILSEVTVMAAFTLSATKVAAATWVLISRDLAVTTPVTSALETPSVVKVASLPSSDPVRVRSMSLLSPPDDRTGPVDTSSPVLPNWNWAAPRLFLNSWIWYDAGGACPETVLVSSQKARKSFIRVFEFEITGREIRSCF